MDSLNSQRGTLGGLINELASIQTVNRITDNLEKLTAAISSGQGTMGKLVNDNTLYTTSIRPSTRWTNSLIDLNQGQGTAGKLLKDDTLYNNFNSTVKNANAVVGGH